VRWAEFFLGVCLERPVFGGCGTEGLDEIRAEPCMETGSCGNDNELAIFQAWSFVMSAPGSGKRPVGLDCRISSTARRN
jgi:hypothetical protein